MDDITFTLGFFNA